MKKDNPKCVEQKKGRYVSEKRKSPPFSATDCSGQTKKGKDGVMYISKCRWYKVKNIKKKSPAKKKVNKKIKKKSPKKIKKKEKKASCNNRNPNPPCKEGYSPKLNKKNIECCYKSRKKKKKSPVKGVKVDREKAKKEAKEIKEKAKKEAKAVKEKAKKEAEKKKAAKEAEKVNKNNKITKFTDYVNKEKIASKVKLKLNINPKPQSEKIKEAYLKKGIILSDKDLKELRSTKLGKKKIDEILKKSKVNSCENSSKVDWEINIENDLNKLKIENNSVFYGKKKLTKGKIIGEGAYGTVDIYTLNNKPMFAVKNVTSGDPDDEEEIDNEIKILLKLEQENIKCNIMGAKILYENKNDLVKLVELEDKKKPMGLGEIRWRVMQKIDLKKFKQSKKIPRKIKVAMSLYDGDLNKFSGKLSNSTILKIGLQLAKINKCLINSGLFYTDFKPQNVLWKCNSKNSIYIRLADIGGIFTKEDDFAAQTFPYPTANYDLNDTDTFALASEKVVVWGLGMLMLLMLPKYDHNSAVSSLVYWGKLNDANLKKFRQKLDKDKSIPQVIKDTLGANKNFKIKIKTIDQIIKSLKQTI